MVTAPDPQRIQTLDDLTRELGRLRRRAAGHGQVQISVREIAAKVGRAPSTVDPYLRGKRLCPMDTYEEILRALGLRNDQLRPWLNAWERVAEYRGQGDDTVVSSGSSPLTYQATFAYRLTGPSANPDARIGIITGDIRRVRCAEIWVNSENTDMRMARIEEFCVSAIIRFCGAVRDPAGHVLSDFIADELERLVAGRRPVAAGTVMVTGAGELTKSNGVRYIVHVAAVQGEPGEGYRQVRDVGQCVSNALAAGGDLPGTSMTILFPLLGAGMGGGGIGPTAEAMLGAAIDHLVTRPSRVRSVLFSAYTAEELEVCRAMCAASPRIVEAS